MDFMQGIGGAVTSYKVDIEASKKLNDVEEVIKLVKETHKEIEYTPYIEGLLYGFQMIESIIEK